MCGVSLLGLEEEEEEEEKEKGKREKGKEACFEVNLSVCLKTSIGVHRRVSYALCISEPWS